MGARHFGLVVGGTVAALVVRRLSRRSGITDVDLTTRLPGDEVIPDPTIVWTRATTLAATPDEVWPWLVQMGFGRGGWYTSERFDRLLWRIDNPSSNEILPQWQHLAAGDIVPDGLDYAAYFRVCEVREYEAIVYHSIRHPYRGHAVNPNDDGELRRRETDLVAGGLYLDFSWAFVLQPGEGGTRLLVRTRANVSPGWLRFTEPALGIVDYLHVSTMFRGIKHRLRRGPEEGVPVPQHQPALSSQESQ